MIKLQFKCTLLTDVVLNQKSATEGPNHTLDFIPGNSFLGIVASKCYDSVDAMKLFHSSKVKFGDAHLSTGDIRGLKVPAVLFYPKLGRLSDNCYVHYRVPNLSAEAVKALQLKQCRSGFYVFDDEAKRASLLSAPKSFAIKSAYDKQNRCSKDAMMYGYESLDKGSVLFFEVLFADDAADCVDAVRDALVGVCRVGRSRTAQYGQVRIEPCEYRQTVSAKEVCGELVSVYADGRLIFLDEYGRPTLKPTADDLGLPGGEIRWDKSQIRSFAYAPWNFKRRAYDAEHYGIEKGSVIVVSVPRPIKIASEHVGQYQNEGFGKVIYNPAFLQADDEGRSTYRFDDASSSTASAPCSKPTPLSATDSTLLALLRSRRKDEDDSSEIYRRVNKFCKDNQAAFGKGFASQWGNIRSIAMAGKHGDVRREIEEYIGHGVTSNEWSKKRRKAVFMEFMDSFAADERLLRRAVVNLAAEMAKKSN